MTPNPEIHPSILKKAFVQFATGIKWIRPMALTLTLKQRMGTEKLDIYAASKNFRHFMSRLNRKVFGNAARRFQRGLSVVPVLEHDELIRFHYHAVIEKPDQMTDWEFREAIRDSWKKTRWGYNEMDLQPMSNAGWINYIGKIAQKDDYALAIDWMNVKADS